MTAVCPDHFGDYGIAYIKQTFYVDVEHGIPIVCTSILNGIKAVSITRVIDENVYLLKIFG